MIEKLEIGNQYYTIDENGVPELAKVTEIKLNTETNKIRYTAESDTGIYLGRMDEFYNSWMEAADASMEQLAERLAVGKAENDANQQFDQRQEEQVEPECDEQCQDDEKTEKLKDLNKLMELLANLEKLTRQQ